MNNLLTDKKCRQFLFQVSFWLLFALPPNAAIATTITFDSVPIGNYNPDGLSTQGYTAKTWGFGFLNVTPSADASRGNFLSTQGVQFGPAITLTNNASEVFSLSQLDVFFYEPVNVTGSGNVYTATDVIIRALSSSGDVINEITLLSSEGFGWRTVSFDETWAGISSLELGWSMLDYYESFSGYDNIVVSAVPVPAAAWLFGSALAGLGWIRRKQTN